MNLIYAAPVHDCHVWNVGGGGGGRTEDPNSIFQDLSSNSVHGTRLLRGFSS